MVLVILLCGSSLAFAQRQVFARARWISPAFAEDSLHRPCLVFKKGFSAGKKLKNATLAITALGLYEARLNGHRIGDAYFTPGWTSYATRLQYQQYDITKLLTADNMLKVTVGEGWYRGKFRGAKERDNYGSAAGLLAVIRLLYRDGSVAYINTDHSWICTTGPIRYSEFYDGELFDSNVKMQKWRAVKISDHTKNILVPSEAPPVKQHERFKPVRIIETPKGEQVVDFGQNMAGWVRLIISGRKGDTVRLAHGELLDKAGNFYNGNLRTAKAVDIYVLNGKPQVLEPHFTYHGFRYVKVTGFKATKNNCTAVALYSNLKPTGTFECSDPLINRLQKNIEWSLKSNFLEVPTDCPQRSERLGWTGDAQVFAATASFLMDTQTFYTRWLKDLAAEQSVDGSLPKQIPSVYPYQTNTYGIAGWGDAATIVPWTVYRCYGNTSILRQQYASMKSWLHYIGTKSKDGLWTEGGYGDWYAPGANTDIGLIDQCYWANSTQLLLNTASVLRQEADLEIFKNQLAAIKQAFVKTYVRPDGHLTADTQTAYVLALQFDLLPDHLRAKAIARLVELIHENNDHLATGFLGTPYLLPVLSRFGYSALAYTLLNQQTCPSWLYPVKMGATTIWERWDAIRPDSTIQEVSFNHYSYGAVGQWLYENVAGIKAGSPGYRTVIIKPEIGGGLTWAKASYQSRYGLIRSAWQVEGGHVIMQVSLPKHTTAVVYVPGKAPVKLKSGNYEFHGILNRLQK
ncbi:family 78 glycoside hydrolase catalytic domain [Mucilaginibacter sp. UR6-11]|uniref:family 78 glycoside hydrolase catalytic domain n=1 Tax=Mucilaginibacter sp. UR6-11 TaxID=1435644 RepID=UPI001E2F7EB8|nr:family 78 glycoside hydrolase catalytic domain [Mucilaginibacter sp. UR6-11]MCC8423609.1 glycoside hydrolase family 78 protein [Mucilaginibacter sp. UR6-11]